MKVLSIIIVLIIAIIAGFYFIDVDQTEELRLPEVSVEGGQAPEFEADVGDIDVKKKTVTVKVPEVEIKEKEVEVPTIETQRPEEEGSNRQ